MPKSLFSCAELFLELFYVSTPLTRILATRSSVHHFIRKISISLYDVSKDFRFLSDLSKSLHDYSMQSLFLKMHCSFVIGIYFLYNSNLLPSKLSYSFRIAIFSLNVRKFHFILLVEAIHSWLKSATII